MGMFSSALNLKYKKKVFVNIKNLFVLINAIKLIIAKNNATILIQIELFEFVWVY